MVINTKCKVYVFKKTALDVFNEYNFDNLNDAVAFQQSSLKCSDVAVSELWLSSKKESEALNEQSKM